MSEDNIYQGENKKRGSGGVFPRDRHGIYVPRHTLHSADYANLAYCMVIPLPTSCVMLYLRHIMRGGLV